MQAHLEEARLEAARSENARLESALATELQTIDPAILQMSAATQYHSR